MAILYYDPNIRVALIIGEIPGAVLERFGRSGKSSPITPGAGNKIFGRHGIRPARLT
jgi:hypothetical protein